MPAWLGTIGGLVGLVVFFGTVVVYLRGSADKGTITTLEKSNEALIQRVAVLEADGARMGARVASLERENASLLAQRPSAEAISALILDVGALTALLRQHDTEVKAMINEFKRH